MPSHDSQTQLPNTARNFELKDDFCIGTGADSSVFRIDAPQPFVVKQYGDGKWILGLHNSPHQANSRLHFAAYIADSAVLGAVFSERKPLIVTTEGDTHSRKLKAEISVLPQGELSFHNASKRWVNAGQPLIEAASIRDLPEATATEIEELTLTMQRFFCALNNALKFGEALEIKAKTFGFSWVNVKAITQQSDPTLLSVKLIITDLADVLSFSYGHLVADEAQTPQGITAERRQAIRGAIKNHLRTTEPYHL